MYYPTFQIDRTNQTKTFFVHSWIYYPTLQISEPIKPRKFLSIVGYFNPSDWLNQYNNDGFCTQLEISQNSLEWQNQSNLDGYVHSWIYYRLFHNQSNQESVRAQPSRLVEPIQPMRFLYIGRYINQPLGWLNQSNQESVRKQTCKPTTQIG